MKKDKNLKYSASAFWSEEDECYVALVPEFPGLSAFGHTPSEAVEQAEAALQGMIEVTQEDGDPLPGPQTLKSYSGQFRLRLPPSLHQSLAVEARRGQQSLNTYVLGVLQERQAANSAIDQFKEEMVSRIEGLKNHFAGQIKALQKAQEKPSDPRQKPFPSKTKKSLQKTTS